MKKLAIVAAASGVLVLAGCATVPSGPSVMVLPGSGRNFDQFRADDYECRNYANYQIGGEASAANANNAAIRDAGIATAIGAVAGAAFGGHRGAAIGAGTGLIIGSAAGAGETRRYEYYGAQRRYDTAYIQCMYSKGHQVPVSTMSSRSTVQAPVAPAAASTPPPPPPGTPPPPPR